MIDDDNKLSVPKEVPAPPVQHDADKETAIQKTREEKDMRENLSEQAIDQTLKDSFPASDPPSWH